MSKIKIKTNINKQIFETEGIKTNNNIIYKDSEVSVKIIIDKIVQIIRENKEFRMELNFNKDNKTTGIYLLKQYNKVLNLDIKTKKIIKDDNFLEIDYIINDAEIINFKLEFEVVE